MVSHSNALGLLVLSEFSVLCRCKVIFIINTALQCARCTTLVNFAMLMCVSKHLKLVPRMEKICMCQMLGMRR